MIPGYAASCNGQALRGQACKATETPVTVKNTCALDPKRAAQGARPQTWG